jgi:hypothetical protein
VPPPSARPDRPSPIGRSRQEFVRAGDDPQGRSARRGRYHNPSARRCVVSYRMNPNKALWEKGDFTRIADTMRDSGEARARVSA